MLQPTSSASPGACARNLSPTRSHLPLLPARRRQHGAQEGRRCSCGARVPGPRCARGRARVRGEQEEELVPSQRGAALHPPPHSFALPELFTLLAPLPLAVGAPQVAHIFASFNDTVRSSTTTLSPAALCQLRSQASARSAAGAVLVGRSPTVFGARGTCSLLPRAVRARH